MSLPKEYVFLEKIGALPVMIQTGLQYLGIKEYPGKDNNNPVIMAMAKRLGVASIYPNDETAWCSLVMCDICVISGKPMPYKNYEILRAASFAGEGQSKPEAWGDPVIRGDEKLGDILVFKRPEGHHVGIYIAETKTTFCVMGGNQGNSYSIVEIPKSRLLSCRRYYKTAPPQSAKKYLKDSTGVVSTNEA